MLFSSSLFVFAFLPIVLAVCFVLPSRLRNPWLLFVSLLFYAWGEKLLVAIMLLSIGANWSFGLWLEKESARGRGRVVIAWATVFNIGLLVLFKYADWIWTVASALLVASGWRSAPLAPLGAFVPEGSAWRTILLTSDGHIRLPIGISFFTFQAFSYVLDVWRRDTPVQKNPLDFALYVSLFPQLIAGPIVRYKDVAQQIARRAVTRAGFAHGTRRFVIGLAKKMLVANVAAKTCDSIFAIPASELDAPVAWLGTLAYTLQIYFDFSGYSDMAIGLGHMLGFRFLENFDFPYIARSISEFWRRWHLSLSTWFRDYLYISLGGNRVSPARTYLNLVTVFALCGMWHGASFNFLVWGLYHGTFLVLERAFLGRLLARTPAVVRHAYTLLVVMVGWVLFRADTLSHGLDYLQAMCGLSGADPRIHPLAMYANPLIATVIACGVVGSTPWLRAVIAWRDRLERESRPAPLAAIECAGLLAISLLLFLSALQLAGNSYNPFIYFRF